MTQRNSRQVFRQHFARCAQITEEFAIFEADRPLYASYSSVIVKNLFLLWGLKVCKRSSSISLAYKNFCRTARNSRVVLAILFSQQKQNVLLGWVNFSSPANLLDYIRDHITSNESGRKRWKHNFPSLFSQILGEKKLFLKKKINKTCARVHIRVCKLLPIKKN